GLVECLGGHDDDKTMHALFLTKGLVFFLAHPAGAAKTGTATAIAGAHSFRVIVRRRRRGASGTGGKIGRSVTGGGVGWRPMWRSAQAVGGGKAIGKILPGQDDGQVGALDVVGEVGAEVHRIHEGDG